MPSDPGVDHDATRRTVMVAVRDLDGPTVRDALLQSLLTCGVDDTVTEVVIPVLHDVGRGLGARRPRGAPRALRLQHLPRGAR